MNVFPASGATCSCMPVGELSDAMCTEPDSLGGTRYCLPEGTLLSVQVADVSAGPDEWCTRGPLVLHERVGGGSTSHASMRALIHPTGARVSGGACCCDDEDWFCLCGWPSIPQYHTFYGGPGGVMFTSLQVLDMYSDDLYFQGGSVTLCSDLPGMDPTLPQKVYFEMKAYTGYQHLYTLVYDEDGELVATVYPAQGLRETTWIETSCAEGRLRGVAETVEQPTLKVDIEVEGNLVPPAVAGHYTFPQPDGCAGARKNYTYAIDNPDPEPDTPTELIAVTAVPHEGFYHVRWKGEGPVFDQFGNLRTDVALAASDEEPERWVRDETIYVKCLDGPVEDGVVHIEDLEPSDRKLQAQMVRPTVLLVQGYDIEKPLVGLADRSFWRMRYGREKIDHSGGPSEVDATQELMDRIAENRFDIFVVNAHGHSDISNFFVVCSEIDIPDLPWDPPLEGMIPPQDCVYPAEIALRNTRRYKLFYASSCGLGKGDNGARWREAFGNVGRGIDGDAEGPAEACITWDETVMAMLSYAFDKAFWESLVAENPADRKDTALDAFLAAWDAVSEHPFWNNPFSGIIARPQLLGDTSLKSLRFNLELPIPDFDIPAYP